MDGHQSLVYPKLASTVKEEQSLFRGPAEANYLHPAANESDDLVAFI